MFLVIYFPPVLLIQSVLYSVGVHDNICGRDDMETYRLWSADLRQEPVERI